VPEPRGLLGQRRDEGRVGMAEGVDRDPGAEIEEAAAIGRGMR